MRVEKAKREVSLVFIHFLLSKSCKAIGDKVKEVKAVVSAVIAPDECLHGLDFSGGDIGRVFLVL